MSNTASLQGEINVRVKSIHDAIKSVNNLNKELQQLSRTNSNYEKALRSKEQAETRASKASQQQQSAERQKADLLRRNQNLIERAANSVANYTQRVNRSVREEEQRNRLLGQTQQALRNYANAVNNAEGDTLRLATAKTRLQSAMGNIGRVLNEQTQAQQRSTNSQAATARAIGQLEAQYQRLVNSINASALVDEQKSRALTRLRGEYEQTRRAIQQNQAGTVQAVQAQNQFRVATINTTEAVRAANREFRGQAIQGFNNRFRDLTSSVQVALGPLSGVASRLVALGGLFRRNALSIASVLASTTAYTVALGSALRTGADAERQMLGLQSQIDALGMSTQVTADQFNEMAHRIAGATMTSADAVRQAQQSLLEYQNIGVNAFEDTILAAQGLSAAFGGTLQSNLQRVARLLDDPVRNFEVLNRQGITFNQTTQDQIERLQLLGRTTEAQNIIMQRFESIIAAAKDETQGLSGALDTLSGNATLLYETLFFTADAGGAAAEVVNDLAKRLKEFSESDNAIALANAFTLSIDLAGRAIGVLLDNIGILSTMLAGLASAALVRAVFAVLRLTKSMQILTVATGAWSAAKVVLNGQLATFIRRASAAAIATKALRLAMMAFQPVVTAVFAVGTLLAFRNAVRDITDETRQLNIASRQLFANTDLFVAKLDEVERNVLGDMLGDITENAALLRATNSSIDATTESVKALENQFESALGKTTQGAFEALLENWGEYARETDKTSEAYENFLGVFERFSGGNFEDAVRYFDSLENAKLQLEDLTESQRNYLQIGQELDDQARETIRNLSAEQKQTLDLIGSIEDRMEASKQMTSADTQRINAAQEELKVLEDLYEAAKDNKEVYDEKGEVLARQIQLHKESIEQMRASTRAAQEEQRQERLMADTIQNLNQIRQRATAFSKSQTEAQLEGRLATIQQDQATQRFTDSLKTLTEAQQADLANRLNLDTQNMSGAEITQLLTTEYTKQAKALTDAEEGARSLFAMRQQLNQIENDSATGIEQINNAYKQQAKELKAAFETYKELSGATEEEIEAARLAMEEGMDSLRATQIRQIEELNREADELVRMNPMTDVERITHDYEQRRATLQEMFDGEQEQLAEHLAELENQYKSQKAFTIFTQQAQNAGAVFEGVTQLMSSAGRDQTREYQYIALAQATMAQGVAIAKAWQEGGPYLGPILAGLAAANVGAQIAQIRSQNFREGGFVSGKGTGTSDSIPAMLSNGEFVLRARAVQALGVDNVERLNQGRLPEFATGGGIGRMSASTVSNSSTPNMNIQVINQGGSDIEATNVEQSYNADGELELRVYVREIVREEMGTGFLDGAMMDNFGQRRRANRR